MQKERLPWVRRGWKRRGRKKRVVISLQETFFAAAHLLAPRLAVSTFSDQQASIDGACEELGKVAHPKAYTDVLEVEHRYAALRLRIFALS